MALWLCEGTYDDEPCGTLYAVGLFRCPRCHSTAFHEFGSVPEDEEHPMAKITRHGGPSDVTAELGDTTPEPEPAGAAGDDTGSGAVGEPSRPGATDRKAAWVEWAKTAGYDPGYVDTLNKADLEALPGDPNESEDYLAWVDWQTEPDDTDEEAEGAEDGPADGAEQG